MAEPEAETQEAPETQTGNTSGVDAALDAAIASNEALMGDLEGEDDDEEPAKPARAEKGQKKAAPEEDDEAEEDEAGEDDAEDTEPEASADEDEDDEPAEADEPEEDDEEDELYDAMATLRKELRVPTSVLKSTPKAKLIAWAQRVAESKGEGAKPSPEPGAASEKTGVPAEPAQAVLADWETFSKEAAEELGVDEKALGPFKSLHAAVTNLLAQNGQLASELKQATASAREREGRATIDTQIRRLERSIPGLAKDEGLQGKIVDEAVTQVRGLQALGKPVDIVVVFDKAARIVGAKRSRSDIGQLKRNGVSHAPTSRPGSMSGDLSENDYFEQAMAMAERGQGHRISTLKPPKNVKPRARW